MTENDKRLEALFNEFVPRIGKADSLAGEIVRAAGRIGYRWSNDGDQIGIGYGKETCNAAARFLLIHGNKDIRVLVTTLWGLSDYGKYSEVLDQLIGKIVEYINSTPELRAMPTEDTTARSAGQSGQFILFLTRMRWAASCIGSQAHSFMCWNPIPFPGRALRHAVFC